MSKWYELHIKNEILFWFIMISIVPIVMLFGANYLLQKNQFKIQAKEHLELILHEKIAKIETQIDDFEKNVKLVSSIPTVVDNFIRSKENFVQNNRFIQDDAKLNELLNGFLDKSKYYDVFFIDMSGNIIYTLKKESDLGTNLLSGIYKDTNLASVYKRARMLLESKISRFEYYHPSSTHSAFIAHPIYRENRVIGVIAIQLAKNKLSDIFSDQKGLGESGEFFAAMKNSQHKIVSTTALKYVKNSIENEFIFDGNKNLFSTKAASGGYGSGEGVDYRGVEVITAWGYIPSLDWGVIAKIDSSEVLEPIYKIEFISIIVIFFVLVFIIIAIVMATKHIVSPIDALIKRVKRFSLGNLENDKHSYADFYVNNEIGVLANNFNEMAQNLKNSQDTIKKYANELEDKVKQRTKELEDAKNELIKTNISMKTYLNIVDKYVIASSTDLKGVIISVSSAFCDITGYTKEELIGKKHNIVRHPSMPESMYKEMWQTLLQNRTWCGEIKNLKKDGTSYWVYSTISPTYNTQGEKTGYTSIRQDITNQKIIEKLSVTDQLTQLYNRLKLESVFADEIHRASRYGEPFSVIMLDIDHFKSVNDTFGHEVGDKTLIDIAKILKQNSRTTDIVGRWGGEEFVVILPHTNLKSAFEHANLLRAQIETHSFEVIEKATSSFGVSCYVDGDSAKSILKRADDALYDAKNSGRNRVSVREGN